MRREHRDDWVRADPIKRVSVASDDALQRVLLHNGLFEGLLGLALARHRRMWNNHSSTCSDSQRIQHVLYERQLVLLRVSLRPL